MSAPTVITEQGVYDLPEETYHLDPVPGGSLSSTTAKALVTTCPAQAKWERENAVYKAAWDLGSVTHKMVLGSGPDLVEVDADNWKTNAAKAEQEQARKRGAVALLSKDIRVAEAMAKAVIEHPIAGPLFAAGTGLPEQSVFWIDQRTGQWCRAMLDWFPAYDFGRPIAVDLKTTDSANPSAIRKSVANYHYHQQDGWYRDACEAVGHDDPAFLFVFVSKHPPYLVTVVQLDDEAVAEGRARNRLALEIWRDCRESGIWPDYGSEIETIGLPRWALTTT
jgi:hypothetical protein